MSLDGVASEEGLGSPGSALVACLQEAPLRECLAYSHRPMSDSLQPQV